MLQTNMGHVYPFYPSKLVIGILLSDLQKQAQLEKELINSFGEIDFRSELMDFTFSHYYDKEMGTPLKKYFLAFRALSPADTMASVKNKTNTVEQQFSRDGRRCINLDPGHLFLSKFILTTTKDGSHRIPLGQGIYAEITLLYEKNTYRPVEWTYPDFRDPGYIKVLNEIRKNYKPQLKKEFDLSIYQ